MPTLAFPYHTVNQKFYAYQSDPVREYPDLEDANFFPIKRMDGADATSTNLSDGNTDYTYMKYIDLDQSLTTGSDEPFIQSGEPWTIDVTMTLDDNDETEDLYFGKNRVLFAMAKHVTGNRGGVITVGTDIGDHPTTFKSLDDRKKLVIGFTDYNTSIKMTPETGAPSLTVDTSLHIKLIYDPDQPNFKDRLKLFLNNTLCCKGSEQVSEYITKPRLYLFTSGWVNEAGWVDTESGVSAYDRAYGTIADRKLEIRNSVYAGQAVAVAELGAMGLDSLTTVLKQPAQAQPGTTNLVGKSTQIVFKLPLT